jgi:hypothetical protein
MKLKITLIVLSLFILLAAGYVAWWMIFNAEFQMEAPIHGDNGIIGYTILSPEHEVLSNVARYGSVPLLLIGIAIFILSFFSKIEPAQITLGAIIAAMAIYIGFFGFPAELVSSVPIKGQTLVRIPTDFGVAGIFTQVIAFVISVLSIVLVVLNTFKLKHNRVTPA